MTGALPDGLRALLAPCSVALVGVSDDPRKMAGNPLRVIAASGFQGRVHPVNPSHDTVGGRRAWRDIADIEDAVDVALIVVPRPAVADALRACGRKGIKAAVVITAGFADAGEEGSALQDELREIAAAGGVRVVGPNCTGCYAGAVDLPLGTSASFATGRYRKGSIALVTQSGAIGTALIAHASGLGLGPSFWFSTGNEMDLSVADFVVAGVADPSTRAFCLYLETIRDTARFRCGALQALEAGKPVIAFKVGCSQVGAEKAQAHTGALIGSDDAYEGYFRQLGVIRAATIEHLLPIAMLFDSKRDWGGGRIGVISLSGAMGACMADLMVETEIEFAPLGEATMQRLAATSELLTPGNPFDPGGIVIGRPQIFADTVAAFLADPDVDVLVVVHPFAVHLLRVVPPLLIEAARQTRKMICVVRWMPHDYAREAFAPFRELDVPVFQSLDECVAALAARTRYESARAAILAAAREAQEVSPGELGPLPALEVLAGVTPLLETEARAILARYGIASPDEAIARTAADAAAAAAHIGFPVALKILSREITHKTEVQGVLLGIATEAHARAGFATLMANAKKARPDGEVEGVLVQRMAPEGLEIILGAKHEREFGAVVMVGLGGVLAEAFARTAVRPVPLSRRDAEAMIDDAGLAPLLSSARRGRASDRPALVAALLALSQLMVEHGARIRELDVNPLRVLPAGEGVLALDALIVPGG